MALLFHVEKSNPALPHSSHPLEKKLRRKGVLEDNRKVPAVPGWLPQEHRPGGTPLSRNIYSLLKRMRNCKELGLALTAEHRNPPLPAAPTHPMPGALLLSVNIQ